MAACVRERRSYCMYINMLSSHRVMIQFCDRDYLHGPYTAQYSVSYFCVLVTMVDSG